MPYKTTKKGTSKEIFLEPRVSVKFALMLELDTEFIMENKSTPLSYYLSVVAKEHKHEISKKQSDIGKITMG